MRIDPTTAAPVSLQVAQPAATGPERDAAVSRRGERDAVALSGGARVLQRAHAAAAEADDVRTGRVAALKAQIQAGAYQMDTDALAERMLGGS